ncbi:MAG: hypothetical protein NVS3B24_18460 [Candidatus Dormibacteria bacterium]
MEATPTVRDDLTRCLEERLPAFYHIALGILGRPAEAEDAVQDSALKAVRSLHTFRSEADICTWVHRILLNRCNDHLSARRRDDEHLSDQLVENLWQDPSYSVDPEKVIDRIADRERILLALGRLRPVQRTVVVMHDSQGWKLDEIAALMEIPLPTAKSHLRRGRQALVTSLGGLWEMG